MGKRTTGRRLAMQALYEAEQNSNDVAVSLNNAFEEKEFNEDTVEFARKLATDAWKRKEELDSIIIKYAKKWPLERIGLVDRSILRLALSELIGSETPHQVVINEALELAKKYSTLEASKFINGILGAYVKK